MSGRDASEVHHHSLIPTDRIDISDKKMNTADVQRQITEFIQHLDEVQTAFNTQADRRGLGVRLDVSDLSDRTRSGRNHRQILSFFAFDRPGVLYREQIVTAVDAIVELIESPYNLGLILGALQSGKTTTALALQFAGPFGANHTNFELKPNE